MIVAALGLEYDEISEFPPQEIIAEKEFTTSYGEHVPRGYVCGLQSKATAKNRDKDIVFLTRRLIETASRKFLVDIMKEPRKEAL